MHFASMSLGILDFLIEWLTQFLIWLIGWVMDLIMLLISDLLYMAATYLLDIVDICQLIFKKLCGMDVYWVTQTGDASGFGSGWQVANAQRMEGIDPLMSMFTNESVTEVLIALSLVSVVMVIVAAIIKVIQTEFSTEGSKNSKGAIFGQALKSLMLFFLVPVCCIGGIGISNALLKAIDRATSLSGDGSTMGSQILVSAISSQNVVREGQAGDLSESDWAKVGVNGKPTITDSNREQYANIIDIAFRSNSVMSPDSLYGYQSLVLIKTFYDVPGINFIVLIGGALLAAYTLLMASFGMVMRLFKATILYVISPPMVALMPLDGGSAFKSWRKNFVGQLLSAYGTVVGLNLLFIILPVVNNINLFGTEDFVWTDNRTGNAFWHGQIAAQYNAFCQMLFTLTGLFMLKDLSKMIGDMIGADDAAGAGAGMAGKVVGTAAKIGTVAGGAIGGMVGKGVGSMMSKKAASNMSLADQMEKKGDKAGADKLREKARKQATVGAAFGNTGNKLGQKAVGTFKGALNKGISMASGGGIKGSFSEETDYDKAMKAKKEKDDALQERLDNGEASIGDWAGIGTKKALKATGKAVVAAGGAAIGAIGGTVLGGIAGGAIGGPKDILPGMGAGFVGGGAGGAQGGWDLAGKAGETFFGDGGAATRKKILATKPETDAGETTTSSTKKTYTDVAEAITKALGAGGGLTSANAIDQSAALGAIIASLEAIASKTEEQKDLIQKLTAQKANIDNTGAAMKTPELTALTTTLTTAGANATALSGTINFNASMSGSVTSKIELDAEALARKIAEQNGLDKVADADKIQAMINKMKKEMLEAYKTELEKMKGDAK